MLSRNPRFNGDTMLAPEIKERLAAVVGQENASDSLAARYVYGSDGSIHHHPADMVVRPGSTGEVAAVMRIASGARVPVVPRGAGTGLSGMVVPVKGGIVLDISRMNRVLHISPADLFCVVEAGVIYSDLNNALRPHGFFFPPAPGSADVATIGGMVAANASGSRAIKYGATRDYVIGMEVVLPGGEITSFGTRTVKNSSGYHLEKLMVGSEGTLGVITKITLRLAMLPLDAGVVVAGFGRLEDAGEAVSNIIASRILPSALEILDRNCLDAVIEATDAPLPRAEALIIAESDNGGERMRGEIERMAEICRGVGATHVEATTDREKIAVIWEARKSVLPALSRKGNMISVTVADDMAVPISQIPACVRAFNDIAKRYGIIIGTYGHAGDGNLHTKTLIDPLKEEQWEACRAALDEIYETVARLGGTTSGEHGIGLSKSKFFKEEHRKNIALMAGIKKVFDPYDIMNPGKIFEATDDVLIMKRQRCEDGVCFDEEEPGGPDEIIETGESGGVDEVNDSGDPEETDHSGGNRDGGRAGTPVGGAAHRGEGA